MAVLIDICLRPWLGTEFIHTPRPPPLTCPHGVPFTTLSSLWGLLSGLGGEAGVVPATQAASSWLWSQLRRVPFFDVKGQETHFCFPSWCRGDPSVTAYGGSGDE